MKKNIEDKIRDVIHRHNRNMPTEQQIIEIKAIVRPRIGFGGKEQIIVNYWTK